MKSLLNQWAINTIWMCFVIYTFVILVSTQSCFQYFLTFSKLCKHITTLFDESQKCYFILWAHCGYLLNICHIFRNEYRSELCIKYSWNHWYMSQNFCLKKGFTDILVNSAHHARYNSDTVAGQLVVDEPIPSEVTTSKFIGQEWHRKLFQSTQAVAIR